MAWLSMTIAYIFLMTLISNLTSLFGPQFVIKKIYKNISPDS